MSEEVYTVEQCAKRLKLHPKTVRRFIREERVRAVKVGRSYRILRSDLEAMTGGGSTASRPVDVRVTSIVDVDDIEDDAAQRLAMMFTNARMGAKAQPEQMTVQTTHDPVRRRLKVVMVGSPSDTSSMLQVIQVMVERR